MSEEQTGEGPADGDRVGGVGPFLGGIASGMVLVGIVWVIMTGGSGGSDASGQQPGGGTPTQGVLSSPMGSASGGGSQAAVPSTLDRCTAAAERLATPLQQAETSLSQWSVHVGAMNQLVVGAITLPQATAFWNQTRVGANRRIADFDAADRGLKREGVDCPTPSMLATRSSGELRACSRHVAALTDEMDAARTAIHTWGHHVQAMEMLRTGKLSPTRATQMWLSMWQRGTDEIDAYRSAARAVRATPGCDGTAGTTGPSDSRMNMHGGSEAPSGSGSSMGSMGSMG